jgi:uncharacterized protein YneF (UPF0154 family)
MNLAIRLTRILIVIAIIAAWVLGVYFVKKILPNHMEKKRQETQIEKLYRYRTYCLSGNDDAITADFNCENFKKEIEL